MRQTRRPTPSPALIVGGSALGQVWLFLIALLVGAVIAAVVHLAISGRADVVVLDPPAAAPATV